MDRPLQTDFQGHVMKPRVLIAEGDESLEAIFTHFLSRHRFDIDSVSTGLECLQRMRKYPCHALVLSRELLGGGGDGVLAVMREEPILARIPVILTSTLSSPDELSRLISPPVVQALRKPFSLTTLLECLRTTNDAPPMPAIAPVSRSSAARSLVTH